MECLSMITVRHNDVSQKVPCGKCAFCLANKRSQWQFRIFHEMRKQEFPGWFLTLTYDEKHVKRVYDASGGCRLSLRFKDVQLFLKIIRKRKFYAKYICVGEYGSDTKRPHYHVLIWTDCPPQTLECLWKRGRIHFGRLTMASAMYTLKYIIQPKQKQEDGLEKTRAQFSKGLGIGYLTTDVYEWHTADYEKPVVYSYIDGKKVALPRYYRNKIFTKHQMRLEGNRVKWKAIRAYRQRMRDLHAKGIKETKSYIKNLRVDAARLIIAKTKFNQVL